MSPLPTSNYMYIKTSGVFMYLFGRRPVVVLGVFVFSSVFVLLVCNIEYNDDGICKIISPVISFLVDNSACRKCNSIHSIISKRHRCSVYRQNKRVSPNYRLRNRFTLMYGYALCQFLTTIPWWPRLSTRSKQIKYSRRFTLILEHGLCSL